MAKALEIMEQNEAKAAATGAAQVDAEPVQKPEPSVNDIIANTNFDSDSDSDEDSDLFDIDVDDLFGEPKDDKIKTEAQRKQAADTIKEMRAEIEAQAKKIEAMVASGQPAQKIRTQRTLLNLKKQNLEGALYRVEKGLVV